MCCVHIYTIHLYVNGAVLLLVQRELTVNIFKDIPFKLLLNSPGESQVKLRDGGGIEAILRAINMWIDDPDICERGCISFLGLIFDCTIQTNKINTTLL